jgi:hypothetical protein
MERCALCRYRSYTRFQSVTSNASAKETIASLHLRSICFFDPGHALRTRSEWMHQSPKKMMRQLRSVRMQVRQGEAGADRDRSAIR